MQTTTGSRGYRGKRSSVFDRSHMENRDPRSFSTTRACWHVAHNPAVSDSRFPTYQISRFPNFPIIMSFMFTSDAVTRGIKVHVESEYAPERSQPSQNAWFFLYTITITNEGAETAQLLTRHWIITDGTGRVEEVRREAGGYVLDLAVPFAARDDIQLSQRADELTIQVGPFKRKTLLPRVLAGRSVAGARFVDQRLHVRFGERPKAAALTEN